MQNEEQHPEIEPQTEQPQEEQKETENVSPRNGISKEEEAPQKSEPQLSKKNSELKPTLDTSPDIKIRTSQTENPRVKNSLQASKTNSGKPNRLLISSIHTEPSPRDSLNLLSPLHGISASSLQHSARTVSFTKAPRFNGLQISREAFTDLHLPSSLKTSSTSLGYGKKIVMSEITSKEYVHYPAPNHYNLKGCADSALKKKFSFGESRAAVAKAWLPGQTTLPPELAKELPGPGEYDINRDNFGLPKTTMKLKGKMFNEHVSDNAPPPNYYTYKTDFVENQRYAKISFGYGKKYDFTKTNNYNPGPAQYRLPSIWDKYDRSRYQNNWRRSPPLTFEQA